MRKATKKSAKFQYVDRSTCKFIREEAERLLSEHFAKFGLSVFGGSAKFDSRFCDMKFKFAVESNTGHNLFADEYTKNAHYDGMNPKWLGKKFVFRGTEYKIVGMKIGGRAKKNIMIERVHDERGMVCEPQLVISVLDPTHKKAWM